MQFNTNNEQPKSTALKFLDSNRTPSNTVTTPIIQEDKLPIEPKPSETSFTKTKECMFWNNDHYEEAFCNENPNETLIARNDEKLNLFKKITKPDTLTAENAMGKVWYSKKDGNIEFFTHFGSHPTNQKTLKPVTKYILQKYVL